jgi:hypothetical protein
MEVMKMGKLSAAEYKRQRIANIKNRANGKANQTLDFINKASYDFKKALKYLPPWAKAEITHTSVIPDINTDNLLDEYYDYSYEGEILPALYNEAHAIIKKVRETQQRLMEMLEDEKKNKKANRLELNKLKRAINKLDDILASSGNAESRYELEQAKGTYDDAESGDIESAVEKFIQQREGKPKIQEF